jgi:hypothetical protein
MKKIKKMLEKRIFEINKKGLFNRRKGSGAREKVSLRRINLEGNTYVQESNASKLPV